VCKSCRKAEEETEEFKAKRRAYDHKNTEHINVKKRAHYHQNPDHYREHARDYRRRNPEKIKADSVAYSHSEQGKLRDRTYRDRHPEKVKQFRQSWHQHNPNKAKEHAKIGAANYKAKKCGVPGSITVTQWRALKATHNYRCLCCGKSEPEITLTIDHVIPFFYKGANDMSNIQPLCEYCNISKGVKIHDYRSDTQTSR
jgi:hypothetical protein